MRPRHYLLLALVVALGIFNYFRLRHTNAAPSTTPVTVISGPVPQSASWSAFDKAATLRDVPETGFDPALHTLEQTTQSAPATDKTVADVKGCQMWLMFYRQSVVHPSKDASWHTRSAKHLDDCVQTHHDAG